MKIRNSKNRLLTTIGKVDFKSIGGIPRKNISLRTQICYVLGFVKFKIYRWKEEMMLAIEEKTGRDLT